MQGCPGANGVPFLGAFGPPAIGNDGFAFDLVSAPAGAPVAVLVAAASAQLPLGGGCSLLVDPANVLAFGATANAAGAASVPIPVPFSPSLRGAAPYGQGIVVDPTGAWSGLALSGGLNAVIGN